MKKKFLLVLAVIALIGLIGCQNTTTAETPSATPTSEPTATSTPAPTATNTPVPTATSTPVPTATNTPVPTATSTPVPTATPTPTVDANVALSQYTEKQLLDAVSGFWTNEDWYEIAIAEGHLKIEIKDYSRGYSEVKADTDWKYEGLVTLEGRCLTSKDAEAVAYVDSVYVMLENGVWTDWDGNVYSDEDVTDREGYVESIYVDAVVVGAVYADGVWKDAEGNVYKDKKAYVSNFYIGEVYVEMREDGIWEGSDGSIYEKRDGAWHEYLTDNVYELDDMTQVNGTVYISEGYYEREADYVEYIDGVWTDWDGNVYPEEDVIDIYGYVVPNIELDTKTRALKFTSDGYEFYLYRGAVFNVGSGLLIIERKNIATDKTGTIAYGQFKEIDDISYRFWDILN